MRLRGLFLFVLLIGGGACNRERTGTPAPVQEGSFLVYEVTEAIEGGPNIFDLKLAFSNRGSSKLNLAYEVSGDAETPPAVVVDKMLIPEDNIITAFDLGRIYLEPEGRERGKRTPCGVVGSPQKYKEWDVFPIEGLCGMKSGTRFYETTTGMLVGFILHGGTVDITGYLKSSG